MDEDDHGKFRLERVKPNQVEFVVEGIKLHIIGLITFVSSHLVIDEAEARGARGGYDHGKFRLERVKPNQVEFVVEGIKLHIIGLITFVSSHLGIDEAEARGARGGYRGGYRAARTTSVRYGQRVRQRVRVRYNGGYRSYRFGGGYSWQMAAAGGALYGYSTYSRRRMYRDYPGRGEGKVESYSYHIDNVFTSYSYRIHIVFTSYSHRTHIILTPCSNRIHIVLTLYSHRIHIVFTSYLHRILIVFT